GFLIHKGSEVGRAVKEKRALMPDKSVEVVNVNSATHADLGMFPSMSESIRAISEHFANTAYGFFLGKRVAYPVVANYVRNTWDKYGLDKSMLNSSTGIFSFQFSFIDCLDAVHENGSWFIRNNLLILKK
ncbi:hypothetical protein Tco_1566229, partial [Tanacetum coccineum]